MRFRNDELEGDEMETPIGRSQPDIRIIPTISRENVEAVTYSEFEASKQRDARTIKNHMG